MEKYIIIGNGVAGTSAAEQMSKFDQGDITILSKESVPFYNRIQLNEYLPGYLSTSDLIIRDPDWYKSRKINLSLQSEVKSVDIFNHVVQCTNGDLYEFDKLLIATGGYPFRPKVTGYDLQGVFTLRTIEDAEAIRHYSDRVKTVVIVGGGLLGLETGNGFLRMGKRVIVLETLDRLLPRQLDTPAAERLGYLLEQIGFELRVGVKVIQYLGDQSGSVQKVCLADGEKIEADMILVSAGIRPDIQLAREMGLECNRGIIVNSELRTSCPDIHAAGDCAEYKGMVYGIWPAAMEQGRIAGMQMIGKNVQYQGSLIANRLKVAGVELASAGEIDSDNRFESIVTEEIGRYQKLVTDQGRLIGCILLGQTGNFTMLSKMIKEKKPIDGLLE
ncbi:MAG: FAD-dependent oxidoreductase [Desulfobulbaceae bacterium]|nr:FAD-dependent oxidoreductase [Desulfobulbaceae bacterium]